ncbi:MAG: class I SAM-dependent methyltransferase [Gammaproteobacteria bacterium]
MDADSQPSRTASGAGLARAAHVIWDDPPHVFHDMLGYLLLGPDAGPALLAMRDHLGDEVYRLMRASLVWRARVAEDALDAALARGVRQYAILGAGSDSFGWRRAAALPDLRVYEIDHPSTQAWKRSRLDALAIRMPAGHRFVGADLAQVSAVEALRGSDWDFTLPGFVSWIAVTMYLTREAVTATLRSLAGLGRGTTVALTYLVPEQLLGEADRGILAFLRRSSSGYGEHFRSLYAPEEIETLLRECGYAAVEHLDPARSAYFLGRSDGLVSHAAERMVVATV